MRFGLRFFENRRGTKRGVRGELSETPKPGAGLFDRVAASLVGSLADALVAAEGEARVRGFRTIRLTARLRGEARVVGRRLAAQWRAQQGKSSAGSPRSPPTAPHQGAGRGMAAAGSRSICLLPLASSRELQAAMRHMCDRMEQALREMRISSRVLHPTSLHEALGVQAFAPFGELAVVSFLGSLELQHPLLLYVADPFSSEWTERCLRQADLVLLVGLAEASPALAPIEALLRDAVRPLLAPGGEAWVFASPEEEKAVAWEDAHGRVVTALRRLL